jgi:hypothetical protein
MDKEQAETDKYKMPLSPRAEKLVYQLAHKTELLEAENARLRVENARLVEMGNALLKGAK